MTSATDGGDQPASDPSMTERDGRDTVAAKHRDRLRRLRLWPAVLIVAVQLFLMFGIRLITDNAFVAFMSVLFGPIGGTVLTLAWWLFFSGVSWKERGLGLFALTVIGAISFWLLHESLKFGFLMYVLPTATTAAVTCLLLSAALPWSIRRWIGLAAAAIPMLLWTTARLDGVDGAFRPELSLRFRPTAEQRFLEEAGARRDATRDPRDGIAPGRTPVRLQPGDWPGFRGPRRDGRLTGMRIATDFGGGGPRELWRTRLGPGWSSFAVVGDLLFTQEQRGEREAIVCYAGDTGSQMWEHVDPVRFTEVVSGAGPRATPTFAAGRIYATGAKGIVNCLDAATGAPIWARNLVNDTGASVPIWGFSSSPLVVDGRVIVFAGGGEGKCLIAYDADTGDICWTAGNGLQSYSSAQLVTLARQRQVLIASDLGIESLVPGTGEPLWTHEWPVPNYARIVQPSPLSDDAVLLGTGSGRGTRRIAVAKSGDEWTATEVWESNQLKPYFNDFVVYQGHAYGFDGNIFCCVDLETGKRRWKGGRYGSGQVLLIEDQGLLLVLSESGEVVLLDADPEGLVERNRFQAVEGKTWNHPVVARGRLYVRNGVEAACFHVGVEAPGARGTIAARDIGANTAAAN